MQTIETIRRRINNVEDLLSIVKTMKTLAAINIRQYERAVEALDDYNRTVELGFQVLLRQQPHEILPVRPAPHSNLGVVIFGSDQGMCGQFNEQIATFSLEELSRLGVRRSNRVLLTLGTRLAAYFEAEAQLIDETWSIPGSVTGITPLVQNMVMKIDAWRTQQNVDRVLLFYNRPLSGASYRPHLLYLLPVNWERFRRLARKEWPSRTVPMFTMEWQQLLSALLRQYLFVSIYRAFAESLMSENASRLATMQSAERNIQEYLDDLNTVFHQQRQHAITEELLDIIAGFEALTTAK
jgi:F-type H+-transporting ATPase subunit gamma